MRTKKEVQDVLETLEECLLDGLNFKIDALPDTWEFEYDKLPRLRRLLLWVLEPRKKEKKKNNNKPLKDFGVEGEVDD